MPTFHVPQNTAAVLVYRHKDNPHKMTTTGFLTKTDNTFTKDELRSAPPPHDQDGMLTDLSKVTPDTPHQEIMEMAYAALGYYVFIRNDMLLCVPEEDVQIID